MGAANCSYASVVSFDTQICEKSSPAMYATIQGLSLFPDDVRTPYSQYADGGVELRFFEIRNIDFRLFLLYHLTQDERFELNAENENGIFIINSGNGMSGDAFFGFFEEFYNNVYADFQLLSKVDIAEFFPIWKTNVIPRHLMSILMDICLDKSRSDHDHCISAEPFCTSNSYEFASAYSDVEADENADFGCVSSPRNPSWYYMRIDNSGSFVIHMEGHDPNDPNTLLDIDFCLWGPFTQQQLESGYACSHLTTDKIIDCSYSLAGVEDAYLGYYEPDHTSHYGSSLADGNITYHVPQSGEYYLMMITNFSNLPCTINFNYASGSGSTDCTIVTDIGNTGPYCVGETIQLTINSVLGASYHWVGPNNFTSNQQNPTIPNCTMANAGTYICTVTVGSSMPQGDSTQVVVYPDPTANFTFVDNICAGSSASFTSTSTTNPSGQTINSYSWTFGDGQTGSGASVSHNYNTPGDYQVTLAVSTGGHCTDQITKTIHVRPQPTASFTATTVCQGNPTQFTSTSTGQNITGYQWNFGDGQSGTGQTANHTYSQAGTYQVTLTVTTTYGCTDQITQSVTVNEQPTASFTATTVCQGQATQFTSTSTGQNITSYQWNFGDGQTGTGPNPTHTYAQAGTYQVILSVESAGGCFHQVTQTVTVNAQPTANFSATTVCQGQATQFTNASTGQGITGYQWNFGDNTTGTGQNPTHTYSQAGSYQVTLTVTTSSGCSDVATQTVIVNPQVHVNITVDGNTTICEGDTVTLHANVNSVNLDFIAPGDILCTDNSIVKPSAWPVSGKTPKGIVFYVDNSGAHGWAVSLTQSSSLIWGSTGLKGTAYNLWRDAVSNMNGSANTQNIKASTSSGTHPAAWNPDASQGWYLPAIGQLNVLFGELIVVNTSLNTVGGTQITDTAGTGSAAGNVYLWSSTEKSAASAYALEVQDGQIGGVNKANPTSGKNYVVRAVIDF